MIVTLKLDIEEVKRVLSDWALREGYDSKPEDVKLTTLQHNDQREGRWIEITGAELDVTVPRRKHGAK